MNYKEISIFTTTQSIDIISGYLTMNGIRGVMIEDSNDFNEFLEGTEINWDYVDEDLMKLKTVETNVKFYLPENAQGIEMFNAIKSGLENLRNENATVDLGALNIKTNDVNEEDWSTAWKKYYHPIKIGKKLVIVPCWEEYKLQKDEIEMRLDPGMAFGTGTHETTRLVLSLIEDTINGGETILDIGTGSGILAIASLLLGAKQATGVDIDELATKIARENAELNNVEDKLTLHCGDLVDKVGGTYDVVCANIVADVIIRLSKTVTNYMHKGSIMFASGIIEERKDEVKSALVEAGLRLIDEKSENGWVALKLEY